MQKHIYSGTCHELIIETKAGEEEEILDLTQDRRFTLESTSRVQLTRVMLQSIIVLNVLQAMQRKIIFQSSLIKSNLEDVMIEKTDFKAEEIVKLLKSHEEKKASFRDNQTMLAISESVRGETGNKVSSKTIRAWYNEFLELKGFKEDLRGVWERESFLETYGYSMRFLINLKNQKKLTVERATKDLEELIAKDPPKSTAVVEAFPQSSLFQKSYSSFLDD